MIIRNEIFAEIAIDVSVELSGFDRKQDLGAGETIVFDYIPSGVVVQVSFDSTGGKKQTVRQGMEIYRPHDSVLLWTTGMSAEDMIVLQWSGQRNVKFPPSIDSINELSSFGGGALNGGFSPIGADTIQQTILAGSSFLFVKGTEKIIRFHSTDQVGVELDSSAIKYPMFEELINLNNIINDIEFYNDTGADIILTIWAM